MGKQKVTPTRAQEFARLYESGMTALGIGLQFGISKKTVLRYLWDSNVPMRPASFTRFALSLEQRFWQKVDKSAGDNGCWEWIGSINGDGYGTFQSSGAHRVSYLLKVGCIPRGMVIDHLCRNRACCNPRHLDVVTERENCLRGIAPSSLYAKRDHCSAGHPYDEANTLVFNDKGWRRCRACRRASYHKHKGATTRRRIPTR